MHLSMFSPTQGRAGIHGHLTRVLIPWVGILILFDILETPRSGDLALTGYQSPICFKKVPIARCMQHFVTQMVHCRDSVLIRFNLVVVLFVYDRKFLSVENRSEKNRAAGVEP